MSSLVDTLASCESPFIQGFTKYAVEHRWTEAQLLAAVENSSRAFPQVRAELQKVALDPSKLVGLFQGAGKVVGKLAPKAAPVVAKAAPAAAPAAAAAAPAVAKVAPALTGTVAKAAPAVTPAATQAPAAASKIPWPSSVPKPTTDKIPWPNPVPKPRMAAAPKPSPAPAAPAATAAPTPTLAATPAAAAPAAAAPAAAVADAATGAAAQAAPMTMSQRIRSLWPGSKPPTDGKIPWPNSVPGMNTPAAPAAAAAPVAEAAEAAAVAAGKPIGWGGRIANVAKHTAANAAVGAGTGYVSSGGDTDAAMQGGVMGGVTGMFGGPGNLGMSAVSGGLAGAPRLLGRFAEPLEAAPAAAPGEAALGATAKPAGSPAEAAPGAAVLGATAKPAGSPADAAPGAAVLGSPPRAWYLIGNGSATAKPAASPSSTASAPPAPAKAAAPPAGQAATPPAAAPPAAAPPAAGAPDWSNPDNLFTHAQDPEKHAQLAAQLTQNDQQIISQAQAGNVDPQHLHNTVMGHLAMSAVQDGLTPDQLKQKASEITGKLMTDGKLSPEELHEVVQSPTMQKQLGELAKQENITDPNSLYGHLQSMASTPDGIMKLGAMMLGIPLALYGLGNMNSPGGILAMLLGGAGIAHGMGAFGGDGIASGVTSLMGQIPNPLSQAATIQAKPAASPPAAAPPAAAPPAPPAGNTMSGLELAMQHPEVVHKHLLDRDWRTRFMFPTPDSVKAFAQRAQKDPSVIDNMWGPSAEQKKQLAAAMAQQFPRPGA